jgi:hypothetical protein
MQHVQRIFEADAAPKPLSPRASILLVLVLSLGLWCIIAGIVATLTQ